MRRDPRLVRTRPACGGLGAAGARAWIPQHRARSAVTRPGSTGSIPWSPWQLGVRVQTLYDLRSQGRGPRGFRFGRELRFRVSEVDACLAQMEADAAARHPRSGLPGPKPDGQVRDIIEILLGTAMHTGEVLALRPCDIVDLPSGMIASVNGTVVQRRGSGAERQDRPKTDASIRRIPLGDRTRTIFANRSEGPLSPYNARRTFRELLALAGLANSGISLLWYRRTGATVIARGVGTDAAGAFLGHASTVITEGRYIEPECSVDSTPAHYLERTLRPEQPDGRLLANSSPPRSTADSPSGLPRFSGGPIHR